MYSTVIRKTFATFDHFAMFVFFLSQMWWKFVNICHLSQRSEPSDERDALLMVRVWGALLSHPGPQEIISGLIRKENVLPKLPSLADIFPAICCLDGTIWLRMSLLTSSHLEQYDLAGVPASTFSIPLAARWWFWLARPPRTKKAVNPTSIVKLEIVPKGECDWEFVCLIVSCDWMAAS